jgi:tetratricopeptide (TPR) repeat protein
VDEGCLENWTDMNLNLPTIDDSLRRALSARGQELGKWARRRSNTFAVVGPVLGFISGMGIIFFACTTIPELFIWTPLALIFALYIVGSLISVLAINQASNALNRGLIHQASHLTARALKIHAYLFPLSSLTFSYAVDVKLRLMLFRSRYIEVEALTILLEEAVNTFSWLKSRKNHYRMFMANYRAIALLGQTRYAEAKSIFEDCLSGSKRQITRRVLQNNLAHCENELGNPEEALHIVELSLAGIGRSKFDHLISAHLHYNKARALTMLNRLGEAEKAANEALRLGEKSNAIVFQTGLCYEAIGQVKFAQGELHEAEMHLKSALDKMISRYTECNPSVIKTRLVLVDLLYKMGREKEGMQIAILAEKTQEELIAKLTADLNLLARSADHSSVLALTMNS